MAEEFERFKRFEYRQNSNLVLQRDTSTGVAPAVNLGEPTGEPESLAGRKLYPMGDKVERGLKKEDRPAKSADPKRAKLKRNKLDLKRGATVLDADVTEIFFYKPTTQQTRLVYEQLLVTLQQQLGDQPDEVLKGAADEVLAALKVDGCKDSERKKNVEQVLGPLTSDRYTRLHQLAKNITDYSLGGEEEDGAQAGGLDGSTGVAVVFDEEEEEDGDGNELMEVEVLEGEEEDDEDEEEAEDKERTYLAAKNVDDDEFEDRDAYELDISKIDPHWLQRELNNVFKDPNKAVATEKEILSILATPDIQKCENQLVVILKYENFELAKLILKNRWKVFYAVRLGQAQSKEEKNAIFEEMKNSPEGQEVLELLDSLSSRRNKEKEIAINVRKEAASLAAKAQARAASLRAAEFAEEDAGGGAGLHASSTAAFAGKPGKALGAALSKARDLDEATGDRDGLEAAGAHPHAMKGAVAKKPTAAVDLSSIAFHQGGHFMANTRVKLPDGAQRIETKNYDEVVVQAFKKPQEAPDARLPISALPDWAQSAFSCVNIEQLNPMQSKVYKVAFEEFNENLLLCAPTGAGKTNVAMLAILNVLGRHRNAKTGHIDLSGFKVIYISPMKALVAEQVQAFSQRLQPYGVTVRELTGDVNLTRQQIEETQVIVTTPEKWDIITRKAGERAYTQLVRLVIIDEIHLLHDSRGPVLEAIIARTIRQIETAQEHIRLVGLSATLPNYDDVAVCLRVTPEKGLFFFGNHYRPVPLKQTYIGVKDKKAIKRYNTMNEVTYEKLMENAGKSQVLIFVHSRKETVKTARFIRDMALQKDTLPRFLQHMTASREILQSEAEAVKTGDLKELLPYGFAVHHAGLPRTDRKLVEDLFADRHIQVLISTATLAWGVNLPAHTVIIKGTQVYLPEKGSWAELSPMDVLQMMGRAGRPQYDTSGHAILITQHSELQYYLSLNNQQLPIESQMISCLPDMLNAEVVLGSVRSREDAVNWLGYTYLYVRMLKNPTLYGIPPEEIERDKLLEQHCVNLIDSALKILDKNFLIKYDRRMGAIQVTAMGRVASHYYIKYPTIAVYNQHMKPTLSDIELLRLFSLSSEFKYMPVREEEKVELQRLMERVPIPVKGSPDETSSKVNVLLQAYISKLKLEGLAMMADMVYVQQSANRIMRAIFEICLRRGWAMLALRALQFCKEIDRRMWSSMTPLRQFKVLPEELLRKIEKKDLPFERYYDLSSTEIGELVRVPKMGKLLHRLIHQFPKLELAAFVQPLTRTCLVVELTITPDFQWDSKVHGSGEVFWVLVEDVDGEQILHHEMFIMPPFTGEVEHTLCFTLPITDPLPPNYSIRVVSDRWLHSQSSLPISFKTLILPERTPPHTELLDLQPLPISALRDAKMEQVYAGSFKAFNPIQTQVFSTLYATNENVLLCLPPTSGKEICLEFAILRMLKTEPASQWKAVYIAPHPLVVKERLDDWVTKLGRGLGVKLAELTGEMQQDMKLLEQSQLVLATPEKWDFVSRRWKTRKVLQSIRLLLVDDLHLLNSPVGSTLEICLSRTRYISAQLQRPIRIVAMANSLANAKDVGDWLGVSSSGLFNFHPSVRTVPLEISLHGFDVYHREARLLAMSKAVYQAVKLYTSNREDERSGSLSSRKLKNVIVFCSDRRHCRLTAIDLLLQAAADDDPKKFLHVSDEVMSKYTSVVRDKMLNETLSYGVGLLHSGLSAAEQQLVQQLHAAGAIQVVVVAEECAWGLQMYAHLVVIVDTKKFTENGYEDYTVADVLQMLGHATRSSIDKHGYAVLFCPSSKREFYKKFIFEPLPVESQLEQNLVDHINAEVVLKTIENKQDAVDWLTWTFLYRRLAKNPNYYGLQGVTHQHLSDYLSELVESGVHTLEQAQCVSEQNDVDLQPLNLGLVAAFYYVKVDTIELFNRSLTPTCKRRALLEILAASSEFSSLPLRPGEEGTLKGLAQRLGVRLPSNSEDLNKPSTKALILLYAHFNRTPLPSDLIADQKILLEPTIRLLHALVDVISSNGWLVPALSAMEICQAVVQAMTTTALGGGNATQCSPLKQLPHFTDELVEKAKEMGVDDIFDLMNMEEKDREKLLKSLTPSQLKDVAKASNRYPVINVEYQVSKKDGVLPSENLQCTVTLERDCAEETSSAVFAPYFPREKEEQWWLVIGQASSNSLAAIKRLSLNKATTTVTLSFEAPETDGKHTYVLYLMGDSYVGGDQEYKFDVRVRS
ncbi:RNA helicase-related protein required for pre-mRNA splicing, related [Neospora caninum Liverpool]|uniref:RNA helicase-related protein required for pre-mRNA splicing, related n=1 Tax=Neospora caninum (strain Liverpool) TaxID=572307 RepID=F0VK75_NEOCL|nr:RNA helicase-related protein required for pre-mRNA splicing, related [Neospora caninum Liverpool]CBZ54476.1 RNA helicase-related protein required for pre-mRNA splicing, related [Neospora caninum Liverpool]CEL69189.1 TPA: RNA helicase-related protein required for pre-mRNA splicing, related [Neospora caninum Liverpool]|eukprot:XP_003884506.1 RNA helicase-related protein required for pre-mRNA splicing, related [Neospora caninum Liverpool]